MFGTHFYALTEFLLSNRSHEGKVSSEEHDPWPLRCT